MGKKIEEIKVPEQRQVVMQRPVVVGEKRVCSQF